MDKIIGKEMGYGEVVFLYTCSLLFMGVWVLSFCRLSLRKEEAKFNMEIEEEGRARRGSRP